MIFFKKRLEIGSLPTINELLFPYHFVDEYFTTPVRQLRYFIH